MDFNDPHPTSAPILVTPTDSSWRDQSESTHLGKRPAGSLSDVSTDINLPPRKAWRFFDSSLHSSDLSTVKGANGARSTDSRDFGATPVHRRIAAANTSSLIAIDNLATQKLGDVRLLIGHLTESRYGSICNGTGASRCVVCILWSAIHPQSIRRKCIRWEGCFGCGDSRHQRGSCSVVKQKTTATGVCYVCGLPSLARGAHISAEGQSIEPGQPCTSYAKDILLPCCLLLFNDPSVRNSRGFPAARISTVSEFYLWLFETDADQRLPNCVCLFHWACSEWLHLHTSSFSG